MRSAIKRTQRAGIALALSAVALLALAPAANAQGISTQQSAAGLSVFSAAEPTFFSPARNAECEASPKVEECDSFTITVRNEGGQTTGVAKIGEEQSCDPGVWDEAGPPSEFKYQWLRDLFGFGEPRIVGEEQTYTPKKGALEANDEGMTLTCRVIATNASGSTVASSQPLRVAPVPKGESGAGVERGVFSTLSEFGGDFVPPRTLRAGSEFEPSSPVEVGEGLVCDPGTWSPIGNNLGERVVLGYRWLVDGEPQSAVFDKTTSFKVPAGAAGKAIQCEVVATMKNGGGEFRDAAVYAASQNRVVVEPVGGEPPKLSGGELTLANTPAISGVELVVKDTLPAGVTAVGIKGSPFRSVISENASPEIPLPCELATLSCALKVPLEPGEGLAMRVFVTTQQPEGEIGANLAEVFDGSEPPALLRSTAEEPAGKVLASPVGEGPPLFGVQAASLQAFGAAGQPDTQAGDRPTAVTNAIQFPTVGKGPVVGGGDGTNVPPKSANVRDVRVTLPPGLVGNPLATLRCAESKVTEQTCPSSARVGAFRFIQDGQERVGDQYLPVFNTTPAEGYPAEFGVIYLDRFVGLYANLVRAGASEGGYTVRVTGSVPLLSPITNTLTTFYGDPAGRVAEKAGGPAFLANPSDCGTSPEARIEADSWQEIGNYRSRTVPMLPEGKVIENCSLLSFGPSISMEPETSQADTPAGMSFELNVPQAPDAAPSLATPPLKDAVVTLPRGLVPSPAQADGLQACTEAQIDIDGEEIDGFGHDDGQPHPTPGNCPLASKIASAKITTPLLPEPVSGSVYLGAPNCSPCTDADAQSGKLIPLYIEARDKRYGVVVKLAGTVKPDPSGNKGLTATFLNGPQFPFSKVELEFKGGPRAALSTPLTCGTFAATSNFRPWSAPETPDATPATEFDITSGPGGAPCVSNEADAPHAPSFEAGVLNPLAASYSPFVLRMSRNDGSQRIKALNLTLPPGLTGKLAGVPACSDSALAAAQGRSGKAEQSSPSCPASSEVGTVTVGAGAGPQPLYTNGKAYLSGPYKGAPLSLAIVTPAVAGPFDLGTVVVRTALRVNPATAQITAESDPFPTMLAGIPLNVRSVAVKIDRSQFTLNPTSCAAMEVSGEAISVPGEVAPLSNRFQVAGCEGLPFKPKLALRLFGGTKRGAHPKLRAVLTARPGEANIARAAVALPRSEFLDQSHIRTVCTRVQFAQDSCPAASVYGHAQATTPLLDEPLSGPVYLRSSSNKLPDLVAALKGPDSRPIEIELAGRVDSVRGGIRNTFDLVPDAPVTKFVLTMQGGKKGLLINSKNLCASTNRATVRLDAQNGKVHDFRPVLQNDCGKQRKRSR